MPPSEWWLVGLAIYSVLVAAIFMWVEWRAHREASKDDPRDPDEPWR